jgi:hypothetical protein
MIPFTKITRTGKINLGKKSKSWLYLGVEEIN